VQQQAFGEYGETIRTISLNGNRDVAHAAFDPAVKCYPSMRFNSTRPRALGRDS
jgi:hypothetical protein